MVLHVISLYCMVLHGIVLYCIVFVFFARYRTVMYRCYSAPANYRVVHLVILYFFNFSFIFLLFWESLGDIIVAAGGQQLEREGSSISISIVLYLFNS